MEKPVEVLELTREHFGEDFPCGRPTVEYLWGYLEVLGGRSMIREREYVDRHYLDDFTNFYARSFHPPKVHCRRLHFFSIARAVLDELIGRAYEADDSAGLLAIERELQDAYLGFVVRRPLPSAQIGRTVLRTYPDDGGRKFTVLRPYRVHLGALRLSIDGLAYQQQDVQAAVCASTSLWCALQKVAHLGGNRTPTPSQVTRAANSPYPASQGLTDPQMATALTALGYTADTFAPGDPRLFRAKLAACLRSHLPVILMVGGEDAGHAVCVTGYRDPGKVVDVPPFEGSASVLSMPTGAVETIYVHDDNLGSHAHYELLDAPPQSLNSGRVHGRAEESLWLLRGGGSRPDEAWWNVDCHAVLGALVPKPWKVRMPVDDLVKLAWSLRQVIDLVFEEDFALEYDTRFSTGVDYRRTLLASSLDRAQLRHFDCQTGLPRHIAIVSFATDGYDLCDLVVDATTIHVDPDEDSLLAIVAHGVATGSRYWKGLKAIADDAEVAIIGAPHSER